MSSWISPLCSAAPAGLLLLLLWVCLSREEEKCGAPSVTSSGPHDEEPPCCRAAGWDLDAGDVVFWWCGSEAETDLKPSFSDVF